MSLGLFTKILLKDFCAYIYVFFSFVVISFDTEVM